MPGYRSRPYVATALTLLDTLSVRYLEKKFDVDGESCHIDGELPTGDPSVVEAYKRPVDDDWRAEAVFGTQTHRPH